MDRSDLRKLAETEADRIQRDVIEAPEAVPIESLAEGVASPFGGIGFQPDDSKAYMQFAICRSFPNIAGPAMSGNYMGWTPAVLERNHERLLHQQINLDHRLKAYDPAGIPRDRIVGSCVATYFPKSPSYGGWKGIPETAEQAPEITAMAVVWKLAEGVRQFLGDHLSGKKRRAVSIEQSSELEHLGIYVPSTREIYPLLDAPDELLSAVTENVQWGGLALGKTRGGEQLAWAYGGQTGEVEFRGTGIVERPAERTARIQFIRASLDTGERCSLPACQIPQMLVGLRARLVKAVTPVECAIRAVHAEGKVGPKGHQFRLAATPCDPVLELEVLAGSLAGKCLWWKFSDVEVMDAAP